MVLEIQDDSTGFCIGKSVYFIEIAVVVYGDQVILVFELKQVRPMDRTAQNVASKFPFDG